MMSRKLKPVVVTSIYLISAATVVLSVYLLQIVLRKTIFKSENPKPKYVDEEILDLNRQIPVINMDKLIVKPFNVADVKIGKDFYNYQDDASKQESSLIYYENTYIQNSGIDYTHKDIFDVVSVLEGTVIDIKEDDILGKGVEIRHTNELITVYQGLSEITVKKDDVITQGQVIGKSGTSNINKDIGNHLHFELYYQGKILNPENCYGKKIEELQIN